MHIVHVFHSPPTRSGLVKYTLPLFKLIYPYPTMRNKEKFKDHLITSSNISLLKRDVIFNRNRIRFWATKSIANCNSRLHWKRILCPRKCANHCCEYIRSFFDRFVRKLCRLLVSRSKCFSAMSDYICVLPLCRFSFFIEESERDEYIRPRGLRKRAS